MSKVLRIILYIFLGFWALMVLYPLFWTFVSSLKSNQQFILGKPWDFPKLPLMWDNFANVWNNYNIGHFLINSVIVTVCSTALALILSASTSYVIARFSFKLRGFLFFMYVSALMIPLIMGLVPLFFLLSSLGLSNTLFGLILVYAAYQLPFGIFVMVGFFKTLPREIEEAASIDGSSLYGTFFKIMLPLSKPGLMSVTIMNFLTIWNEYIYGVVLVSRPETYTLPVGIAVMQVEMQYKTEYGPLFAALVISMIPVFIVYVLFQRQISGGITAGAVK
ncbi:carbohydrate ABC transporter permease [Paenibacillus sp. N1-5-1-14]|uniref:carbohydrate ABC transporter permease n=1 Tax=Paenibacillus radicibacter TaxID=2972488 RepID=UPI0021598EA8|nr:carbohydrate ABC transporter permease [Paenibacillus radicibacter]MCR8643701.1 carbohydrate ABC transporter permease [Paenibacillus radicibacter]